MNNEQMKGTTIRFPKALKAEITRVAKEEHRTFGQQVRAILEDWKKRRKAA